MKKRVLLVAAITGLLITACGGGKNSSKDVSSVEPSSNVTSSSEDVSSTSSVSPSSNTPSSTSSQGGGNSSKSSSQTTSNSSSKPVESSSKTPSSSTPAPSSSSAPKQVNIMVNNLSRTYCDITDASTKGVPGDDGYFKLQMKDKYEFISISIKDSKQNNVEFLTQNNVDFTFVIPSDGMINVKVEAKEKINYVHFYLADKDNIALTDPMIFDGMDYNTYPEYDAINEYYVIPENSKIRIKLPNPNGYKTIGITIGTKTYSPNEYGYVCIDLTGMTGNVTATVFAEELSDGLHAINSDHLSITFYSDEKLSHEIQSVGLDKSIYIKISSTDIEGYVLKQITYTYLNVNSTVAHEGDITDTFELVGNYYVAKWESALYPVTEAGYKFTVTEDDLNKYKNEPFVGEYMAINLATYRQYEMTEFNVNHLTALGSGKVSYGKKEFRIGHLVNKDNGAVLLQDREENSISRLIYQNDVIIAGNGNSDKLDTPFTHSSSSISDDLICFKIQKDTAPADYSLNLSIFTIEGITYTVATCYLKGEFYRACYTERSETMTSAENSNYSCNINIELFYGSRVTDKQAVYKIMDGTNLVKFVGFKGEGGTNNRIFLEEPCGVYTNGDESLIYCGESAIYKGNVYLCSVNGNVISMQSATADYELVIDPTTMTYTVNRSIEKTVVVGPFAGKAFRLRWYPNGINHEYGYYIIFDETEAKMSCVCDVYWDLTMTNMSSNAFGKTVKADYLYDPATGNIEAFVYGYQNKLVKVIYHWDGTNISFNADDLSGGQGVFTNTSPVVCEPVEE